MSGRFFALMAAAVISFAPVHKTSHVPEGWFVWHSYTDYSAMDSCLYYMEPNGKVRTIDGNFVHAMNGSFGITPDKVAFMAIDKKADEWDIFIYNAVDGSIENMTERSGFRNEDPKWSPDGKSIVFKRGKWNSTINDFQYDLALLDVQNKKVTMLTDDVSEEAMPCFSADGKSVYYAGYEKGIGSIYRMYLSNGKRRVIYSENGVNAYYPIVNGKDLYFTKWLSRNDHHDQLMHYDGRKTVRLSFNRSDCDFSDICPVGFGSYIYSSTQHGDYDLYYFNGREAVLLSKINSERNELGADFFALS